MSTPDLKSRYELALAAAREAGQLALGYFQSDSLAVEQKADASPVTVADRRAEELLRERIAARFPDDAILGEEHGEQSGTSGFRWIVDPIDGTKSFVHGVPLFGTLVGVEHQKRSVIGVIVMPALDECVYAAVGQGAWHQRGGAAAHPARVSACARLSEALFLTSEIRFPNERRQQVLARLVEASRLNRTWGDCYGYALVATGRAEVMVDPAMNVWDAAALQPILTEAGGTLTDWQGNETIYAGEAIATNGKVLDEVLAITRGA
jgi:histidinol phosphatase-like enzyme (inositol monophosphatase family)